MYLKVNPNILCLMLCSMILLCFVKEISSGRRKGVPHMTSKIVGGQEADIKDYPYQLSLQYGDIHDCGASIISATWALTAAHCDLSWVSEPMYLRAGSSNRDSGGSVHKVVEKLRHPEYNSRYFNFDLALLRVGTPFTFGPGVAAVALPNQGQDTDEGLNATVSGWGHTKYGGQSVTNLRVVFIPVINETACKSVYKRFINRNKICALGPNGGMDACQGDSGGPMVVNNEQVGVVSTGKGCGLPGYPGIYARVSEARDWIKKVTGA